VVFDRLGWCEIYEGRRLTTTFLATRQGDLINSAHVRRIVDGGERRLGQPKRVILAVMDDGGEHELAQFADVGEVEDALLPVVPAAPGYTWLVYFAHDPPVVERFPVVAWRIDGVEASPVTFEDYAEAGNIVGAGILVPDGRVICPREATFPSEAEWAEAMLRRVSERAQPRP
jgi:hypothetical protein